MFVRRAATKTKPAPKSPIEEEQTPEVPEATEVRSRRAFGTVPYCCVPVCCATQRPGYGVIEKI